MKELKKYWIYSIPTGLLILGIALVVNINSKNTKVTKNNQKNFEANKVSKQEKLRTPSSQISKKGSAREPQQTTSQLPDYNPNDNWDLQFSNLKKIEKCYEKEGTCGFPQTDPKSEYFAIGERLKKDLLKMQNFVVNNNIKNEKISEIANHFLATPDGHVKKAAMHLMATQETDLNSLDSLLNNVINYHDSQLIEQAMLELKRYLGNEQNESKINNALIRAMKSGAPFVSTEVSKHLGPFLNQKSYPLYKSTLDTVSKGSHTHKNLKNVIAEYQLLMQSA